VENFCVVLMVDFDWLDLGNTCSSQNSRPTSCAWTWNDVSVPSSSKSVQIMFIRAKHDSLLAI
jgi:hypothetical protein